MLLQLLEALGVIRTQAISPPSPATSLGSPGDTHTEYPQAGTQLTHKKRNEIASAEQRNQPPSSSANQRCQCFGIPQSPLTTPTSLCLESSESRRSHVASKQQRSSYDSDPTLNDREVTLDASGTRTSLLDKEASDSEFDAPSPILGLPRRFKGDGEKGSEDKKDLELGGELEGADGGSFDEPQPDLQGTAMMDRRLNPGFLFDVAGMVVVITGGGTGMPCTFQHLM